MHLRHDVFDVEHDVFTVDVFIVPPFCLSSWLLQTSWSLIVNSAFETGGFRCGTWCFHSFTVDVFHCAFLFVLLVSADELEPHCVMSTLGRKEKCSFGR